MIRFWFRELMGWALMLFGLYLIFLAVSLMTVASPGPEAIFEGPPIGIFGAIVFRGGIHLLKVAMAARVCLAAQVETARPVLMEKRTRRTEMPYDW
jgi:hypothetical protein